MKPKDPDTFIDIGVSITRLLLIASGQGTAASLIGEGAGLLRNLRSGGQRAISAEKIAADVAARLPRENWDISEADWHAAATHVAPLIDRLSEKDRLTAGYDWTALRPVLLDLGGEERRRKLADESARRAFDWVLGVACQHITDCFTQEEALASLLKKVNEDCARLQRIERLLDRPGVQETSVVINDHIKVLRHLVPDALVDREQELADLEAFVRNSGGAWYAMEADMVSGKTTVMASFALNPPDDVHMASFFIRRIGGDGNDRGSFAFVMGAQLAKILGHEYTEPVRDPAQCTEFRQLLRRAATASRSATVPRTLVLLIDGIDEDSYFENPDGADAKSILSLLPRHLPEGVKIITASRPNPRLPEDVLCDANRRIVSLKPSPIAEKSINRKDMKIFFKSDIAVDIGAFLAACGGVLTVQDLSRLLTTRRHQRTRTWDVREYVDRSPGRILTPVDVGFGGQEVLAYCLGHDVVTRAVIRELDPDSFGESDEPEDERWWAPIREKALAPYRAIIRNWVKECAKGWGKSTPSYVLSGACFDLMINDKKDDGSSIRVVLDQGRYNEMRRRSGRKSPVLRMIDRECFKTLGANRGELSENTMTPLLGVAESRKLLVQASTYVPGLLKLYVLYFNITPEAALDMIMTVDEPKDRLDALREAMKAAMESGRGRAFLTLFLDAIGSLVFYRDIRDDILRLLADVLVFIGDTTNGYETSDNESVDLRVWFNEVLVSIKTEEDLSRSLPLFENVDGLGKGANVVELFLLIAEDVVERIEDPEERARALAGVADALARTGLTGEALAVAGRIEDPEERARVLAGVADALVRTGDPEDLERARRVAENAMNTVERIENPRECVWALVGVVGALARTGLTGEALAVAGRIEDPEERARVLAGVAGVLARAGRIGEALAVAGRIENPRERVWALAEAVGALARTGDPEDLERARRVAENAVNTVERIENPRERVWALAEAVGALARAGDAEGARRVAENAVNTAERIENPRERVWALAGVAGALARAGDPEDLERARRVAENAVNTAERIENPRERARALAGVVGALARAGDAEGARRVAENAVNTAERIENPRERARALAGEAGALARTGDPEDLERARRVAENAVNTVERIENPRERVWALAEAVGALARAGDAEGARRVAENAVNTAERIENPRERVWALAGVVGALARAGDAEGARRVAENAVNTAERIENPRERARALAGVAGALARTGDPEDLERARRVAENAVNTAERIENPWERARALAEAVGALARTGDAEGARRVAENAVNTAERIENPWARARALAGVAGALAWAGLTGEALAAAGRISWPEERVWALAEAADALARAGDPEDLERARRVAENAVNTAERIENPRERARALAEAMGALARAGDAEGARRVAENAVNTAERIRRPGMRAGALAGVAGALAQAGLTGEALAAAGRISWPEERALALAEAADALARAGDAEGARRVAENAVNTAERIEEPWERALALAGVAGALARAGWIGEALAVAGRIENPRERARALAEAAGALARAGAIDEAREIVTMINEPSSRSRAQSAVIKALVRKGSSDEAVNMLRAAFAEVEGLVRRQDAAAYCATLAAACLDAADLVDAGTTTHEQWLGLARSALARSWLYGATVWNRFDVLLRVAPDLATRLVEERLLADPEPRPGSDPGPEGPGGGAPSSR